MVGESDAPWADKQTRKKTVRVLRAEDRASLELFAAKYPFKPYRYYDRISQRRLGDHFHQYLCATLDQASGYSCVVDGQTEGVLIFEYLPWDSRIFDIAMAKIDLYVNETDYREALSIGSELLATVDKLCAEKGIKHLTCRVNTQEIPTVHALESHSFRLMDTITVLSIQPDQIPTRAAEVKTDLCLREMRDEDLPGLSALSRTAFTNRKDIMTRFNGDPLLMAKAGDLYSEWLYNSYRGEQADMVFVAEVDSSPIGFITCKLSTGQAVHELGAQIGSVPLNAVDPNFRGLGVYRQLVVKAIDWFRQQSAEYVEIKTQIHTLGIHRTWQELNGRLVHSYHVLHQWRGDQA